MRQFYMFRADEFLDSVFGFRALTLGLCATKKWKKQKINWSAVGHLSTVTAMATPTDSCMKFNDSQLFCGIWNFERLSSVCTIRMPGRLVGRSVGRTVTVCIFLTRLTIIHYHSKWNCNNGYFHRKFVANSSERRRRTQTVSGSQTQNTRYFHCQRNNK